MIKIVKCIRPKGFMDTSIIFTNPTKANEYVLKRNSEFYNLKNKCSSFELNKKNMKKIKLSRPKKYLLTKVENKYKLWEELN